MKKCLEISSLCKSIDTSLRPHVPQHGKIALLDFPTYANVGDSAIWLGQIKYFLGNHRISPRYVSSQYDFDIGAIHDAIGDDGVIFISGGGNFGDLWPNHQLFKEYIIRKFPANKIVQLPQSIHFDSSIALKRTAEIIDAHPDFTLLVRDAASFKIAQDNFKCKIELCPDMAFCLGAIERIAAPVQPLVMLMRTDKEKAALMPIDSGASAIDWLEDDIDIHPSLFGRIQKRFHTFLLALNKNEERSIDYQRLANSRLNRGVHILSQGEKVTTDRLHAYILCLLLDIPCMALDNSYGKISNFINTWITHDEQKLNDSSTIAV